MNIISKKFARVALGAAVLGLLTVGGQGVSAQEKPKKVGQVVDIDGTRLTTNRLKEEKWYQAYQSMPTYFKERLETDAATVATISFDVGGRAVISKGSKVEILNEDIVLLKSGTMWAKFDKEKLAGGGKKFQIETAGGVMGIEGTEFIVVTNPDGTTKLTVIEGTVDVSGEKVTKGKKASFGNQTLDVLEYAAYSSPEGAVRDLAFKDMDPDTRRVLRPIVNRALWYVPGRYRWGRVFYGRNFWYARRGLAFVRNPRRALGNEASNQVARHTGVRIPGGMFKKKPPHPVQEVVVAGGTPGLKWERPNREKKKIKKYNVVLAGDAAMTDVIWYGTTSGSKAEIEYPSYGPALDAGKTYYVAITPVDSEGESVTYKDQYLSGKSSFVSEGHTPKYGTLAGVTVVGTNSPPEVSWTEFRDAAGYKVDFNSPTGSTVWSADVSEGTSYTYPSSGRALGAGDYQVKVEAFDAGGVKMAESSQKTFASAGWSSLGLDNDGWEARAAETQGYLDETSTSLVALVKKAQQAVR